MGKAQKSARRPTPSANQARISHYYTSNVVGSASATSISSPAISSSSGPAILSSSSRPPSLDSVLHGLHRQQEWDTSEVASEVDEHPTPILSSMRSSPPVLANSTPTPLVQPYPTALLDGLLASTGKGKRVASPRDSSQGSAIRSSRTASGLRSQPYMARTTSSSSEDASQFPRGRASPKNSSRSNRGHPSEQERTIPMEQEHISSINEQFSTKSFQEGACLEESVHPPSVRIRASPSHDWHFYEDDGDFIMESDNPGTYGAVHNKEASGELAYLQGGSDQDITQQDETSEDEIESEEEWHDDFDVFQADNNVALTVDAILPILLDHSNGCTEADHQAWHDSHQQQYGDNHYRLSHTYACEESGQSLRSQHIGLTTASFPQPGQPRAAFSSADTFKRLFEGNDGTHVKRICLHLEDHHETEHAMTERMASVTYDFDSLIIFPTTWHAFTSGFRWAPTYNRSMQITSNLHVKRRVPVYDHDGRMWHQSLDFQHIPHLYLGSVDGFQRAALYIFFPRLIDKDRTKRSFRYLTDHVVQCFTDKVFLPIYERYHRNDHIQHIPASQSLAEHKAQARGKEHLKTTSAHHFKSHSTYPAFQGDEAGDSWAEMVHHINHHAEFECFQDAFLVMNAKGLKLDFKETRGLGLAMNNFRSYLSDRVNIDLCEDVVVDVGREICELKPEVDDGDDDFIGPPTTYLMRTCCLEREYERLRGPNGPFAGHAGNVTFYHNGTLEDAKSMTLVPPKRSPVGKHWHYMHRYNSIKLVGDAQSVFLFSNEELGHLAADSGIWTATRHGAARVGRHRYGQLVHNYQASKVRTHLTYTDSTRKSHGTRVELRIGWKAFEATIERLAQEDMVITTFPDGQVVPRPRSMWAICTEAFCNFMHGNYEKKLTLLETVIACSERAGRSRESTMLIATIIKDVQRFHNSQLNRELILWLDQRVSTDRAGREENERGLGYELACPQTGYGWWKPALVDWEQLYFFPQYTAQMYGYHRGLRGIPSRRGRLMQDTRQVAQVCFAQLQSQTASTPQQREALHLLVHLCLRQYREDVVLALRMQGQVAHVNGLDGELELDVVRFDEAGLWAAYGQQPYRVTHNRTTYKDPRALWELIWGEGKSQWPRTHFVSKPFREVARRYRMFLRDHQLDDQAFETLLYEEFWTWHPTCPYPDSNGTLISTRTGKGKGERQWWSAKRVGRGWAWDSGVPATSMTPKCYPISLNMTHDELQAYFTQL